MDFMKDRPDQTLRKTQNIEESTYEILIVLLLLVLFAEKAILG